MNSLSVSSLNNQIKSLLETTFLHVSVEGEVSRITYHNSGHVYFTLKDENSSISCVMFRGNNMKMKFRLEEGMAVVVNGSVSVYAPRGNYQINVTRVEPAGEGALALAYEQLKKALHVKGYFEHKQAVPKIINHIALVTSATGAALQDMLRVAEKRWPLVKITIIDTIVQGESSGSIIAQNIKRADTLGVDVIVIGRGGGSIEDLWGFNEEVVADAIHFANTPIVSAVGHEIDFVISDFVADLRAPTPSAAMEMILPDKTEVLMRLDEMSDNANKLIRRVLHSKIEKLNSIKERFKTHSIEAKTSIAKREIELLKSRFSQKIDLLLANNTTKCLHVSSEVDFSIKKLLSRKQSDLNTLRDVFEQNNPGKNIRENYAQIVKSGKKSSLKELCIGDKFELQNTSEIIKAEVIEKNTF